MGSNRVITSVIMPASVQAQMGEVRCLDINDIDLFDRNPRRSRNPAYTRIKNSILAKGLDQPLIVTRRPNKKRYVVHAGGNTRLQILKELSKSSGDPSFSMVNCIYVDWNSESAVLLAHLRENDLRGKLTFIDKAAAIAAVEELLAAESGSDKLSVRDLQRELASQGYSINIMLLFYMQYAVKELLPVMPVALSEGLGRPQIHMIHRLHRVGSEIWTERQQGSATEFDGIFAELCRRTDAPDWSIDPLRNAVEVEIAEAVDLSIQVIRLEIEYRLNGEQMPECPSNSFEVNGNHDEDAEASSHSGQVTGDSHDSELPESVERLHVDAADADEIPVSVEVSVAVDNPEYSSTELPTPIRRTPIYSKLGSIRQIAYQLADGLAHRHLIGNLIQPSPNIGVGYLVVDLPDRCVLDDVDEETRAGRFTMWWQLLAFSETLEAPPEVLDRCLAADSELGTIINSDKLSTLFRDVDIIAPGQLANLFWNQLSEQDWQDWLLLANSYRDLKDYLLQNEISLWEPSS